MQVGRDFKFGVQMASVVSCPLFLSRLSLSRRLSSTHRFSGYGIIFPARTRNVNGKHFPYRDAVPVFTIALVHITVYCPECQSRYQLQADLRGRKMRCPNGRCQAVFVVQEAINGTNGPRAADARGELVVPLIGDGQVRHAAPVEEFDWRAAPPPVRAERVDSKTPVAAAPTAPRAASQERPPPKKPPIANQDWDEPPAKRRWGFLIALGLLIPAGAIGYLIHHAVKVYSQDEDTLRAAAEKDYDGGAFGRAGKKYHQLAEKHGGSPRAAEYRFRADLSDLRDVATRTPPEPAEALALAESFVKQYDVRDPQLKANRNDVSAAFVALATGIADAAESAAASNEGESTAPELLNQGTKALDLLRRFPPKDASQIADLQAKLDRAGAAYAKAKERRRAIDEVLALLRQAHPDILGARRIAMLRQVADDPIVKQSIERAEAERVQGANYVVLNTPPATTGPAVGPASVLLETATKQKPQGADADVVLAAARGLLIALDGRDGHRLWACRVGLDSGELPARIPPARGDAPELVLVAATDPPSLTARDAHTGAVVWYQRLEAPCLGRPVRSDAGQLFVPTAGREGFVYDLDARTGLIRGRFETHQPLAAGGAYDAGTQRLYVPAHVQGVYVFSYESAPKCEGMLATGHAAGSLRGEPIVVSGDEGIEVPRYLVLGEADGLGAMTLRAFRLLQSAIESVASAPVRLPGWSWFPPYHDPETIALVTDAGAIGLFGIQQAGNDDPALYPLVPETGASPIRNLKSARAQLVHAEDYGFWVLADGVLKHWRLGLTRREGRKLTAAWGQGVQLGAPLHAAQVSADRKTLYIVTQTDSPPTTRATAVDARTGEVIWQRPLGVAVQGDSVALGDAVIVLDQSGGLYCFDPAHHAADATAPFQPGGKEIAKPIADLVGTPYLLAAADGQSAWSLLARPAGEAFQLTLRRVAADGTVTSGSVAVPAPIAGSPALGLNAIVLPLANGQLCRVTLDAENPRRALGPDWRMPGSRPDARGHVVHWKGDEFLVSDGGRRLVRLSWSAGSKYDLDTQRPLELPQRLVGTPVALPGGGVIVADASGAVTLVNGDRPTDGRKWQVGPVTAGPWVVGDRVAVVVDRRKLVWVNPAAGSPVWTYTSTGDGIEAPPRIVDGKLIVADLAGRFVALDASTGKPLGGLYEITAEAAPAGAVTPFGVGRLFAPLTDGTALLLPLAELVR
jgi:outer membrane protein assembly factor BamB